MTGRWGRAVGFAVTQAGWGCFLLFNIISVLWARAQVPDDFNPGSSNSIYAIAVQADGKILLGGNFTSWADQPRNGLVRLHADGSLDENFNPVSSGYVETLVVQTNGQILVGGGFISMGGKQRNGIARVNPDGTLDGSFAPRPVDRNLSGVVHALALQSDGKIVVGGGFTQIGGVWRTNIARLYPDGDVDPTFDPGATDVNLGHVLAVCLQPDGKILAGGWFSRLGGVLRNGFGRLNEDGTLDATFDPKPSGYVYSIAVQADGQLIVGGVFTSIGGQPRNRLARLGTNGVVDLTFNPGASGRVDTIALQADGHILVGGTFTNLAGQPRTYVARLDQDGTLDLGFDPVSNARVRSLTIQPDGKLLLGGDFTVLAGQPRLRVARLNNSPAATQNLAVAETSITWWRGGSAPEVRRTSLELSTNGVDWTSLGPGVRIPGGWQFSTPSGPPPGIVRARGFISSGEWAGSSWFVESSLNLMPVSPLILTQDGSLGFQSGEFGFTISGSHSQSLVIEASTNLVDWLPIRTNPPSPDPGYFSDPESRWHPQRFYRLKAD